MAGPRWWVVVVALVWLSLARSHDVGRPAGPAKGEDVVPEEYDLFLWPKFKEGEFEGEVNITVRVRAPTERLVLHAKNLQVGRCTLSGTGEVTVAESYAEPSGQAWVVRLSGELSPGSYLLSLSFSGSMLHKNFGLYRSSYTDRHGQTRYLATSQFEPTYAREAFPCFDEPALKAKFRIRLARPSTGFISLSNMNKVREIKDFPEKGVTTDVFKETPLTSTYLLCFVVCDFPHLLPVKTKDDQEVTVYARESQVAATAFARDVAVRAMDFFTDFLGVGFPLPKLDIVAVPDFLSGAMENWGLMTFRETNILASKDSNAADYERVARIVIHEVAHMWFGNLVTMSWWEDLWLKEGFATYLASVALHKLMPSWDVEDGDMQDMRWRAMIDDARLSSHPIITPVSHPYQIRQLYNRISYDKGACVLTMLESLEPEKFRSGLKKYLEKFSYSCAVTNNLWETFQEGMDYCNLTKVMGSWTRQMGYPLVTVTMAEQGLVFSQQRFLSSKSTTYDPSSSPYGYKWDIPITFITSVKPNEIIGFLLTSESNHATIPIQEEIDWFKVNSEQKGFYRVNYPKLMWKKLENVMKENSSVLDPGDRANLLDDAFALAHAGYIEYDIPLSMASYIKNMQENSSVPLEVLLKHFTNLKTTLYKTQVYPDFRDYVLSILKPLISDSLWTMSDNDTFNERKVKNTLISIACMFEVPSALQKARDLFSDWINGRTVKPHAQLRKLVYRYGINGEDLESNWDKLWELYINEASPQERLNMRAGLASARSQDILLRLLELAKNEKYVRSQDYLRLLRSIAYNPLGVQLVWNFVRDEWMYLVKRFTLADLRLGQIFPAIAEDFSTEEQLQEMRSFFSKYPEAGAGQNSRLKAVEIVRENVDWRKHHLPKLAVVINELKSASSLQ